MNKKSNIVLIVPLAGEGSRMKQIYAEPKPMINIDGRSIIQHSMDSFIKRQIDKLIFVVRTEHVQNWQIDDYLKEVFQYYHDHPDEILIFECDGLTSGAVETVLTILDKNHGIEERDKIFIWGSDVKISPEINLENIDFNDRSGHLVCFKSNSKNYSYCKLNENREVIEVKEKQVISEYANVGLYGFKSWELFKKYAFRYLEIKDGKEKHIAPLYQLMIDDGHKVRISEENKVHIFGTLEELDFYKKITLNEFGSKDCVVALSSDHSGRNVIEWCKNFLNSEGISWVDFGCYSEKATDYALWSSRAVKALEEGICTHAIFSCNSGQGQNLFANKFKHMRTGLVWNKYMARKSVEHSACNSWSLPQEFMNEDLVNQILGEILNSSFQGGRHQTRLMEVVKNGS